MIAISRTQFEVWAKDEGYNIAPSRLTIAFVSMATATCRRYLRRIKLGCECGAHVDGSHLGD